MPHFICVTCGAQYAETDSPPEHCGICEDERQYVGWSGQQWTALAELRVTHRNRFTDMAHGGIQAIALSHPNYYRHRGSEASSRPSSGSSSSGYTAPGTSGW